MYSVSKYPADVNVRNTQSTLVFQCSSDVNVVVFVVDLRFSISIKENERTISHGKGHVNITTKNTEKVTIPSRLSA